MDDFVRMFNKSGAEMAEFAKLVQGGIAEYGRAKFATSFSVQLELTANVLRANGMPQATINMALAARCGVPLEPIDCKSMYVQWTEDEPKVEQ